MRRYTTPTQVLVIDKPELIDTQLYVTYKQNNKILTVSGDDLDIETTTTGIQIFVELTQLQTAGFVVGPVLVQVNWIDSDGVRGATDIATFQMKDNLLTKEIAYE